jgi:hypothetical protein
MQYHVPDNLSGKVLRACTSRRGFLRQSLFAGVAAAISSSRLGVAFADDRPIPPGDRLPGHGKAKRAIFIYLSGGPSHIDTFDPKPGRPTGGPFTPVKTPIPGVVLGEHLPKTAARMLDVALIRSMTSKEGNHSRARTLVHTGYPPEATVKHPTLGSSISAEIAPEEFELPSFVSIGPSQDGPAFLGVRNAPFVIGNPERPPENMDYHAAVGKDRVERRLELLADLQADFATSHGRDVTAGQDDMFAKAKRLMDSELRAAFELDQEKPALRAAYGEGRFGQGVLMARRLAEAGVSCVEVVLNGWDTHDDNFERVAALCGQLDAALATLLSDLSDRGMLDSTLVACFGEFGRTPKINARGGRDHWAKGWSALLAGGGVMGGQVIGETDADGNEPALRPVQVADLHASIWHAFGVDPWTEYTANDRPILLTPKEGRIVQELFV